MIRRAVIGDVPELVSMGRRFRAQTAYALMVAENPDQMTRTATSLIDGDNGVIWVSEDKGGALTGMMGLVLFQHPMSGELTAGELFWWSELPGVGLRLFERGRIWAEGHGAKKMQMTQPEAEPRLADIYDRLGFQRVEVAWQIAL